MDVKDGVRGKLVEQNTDLTQYNFRVHALEGSIPGVKKASW